MKRQEFPVGMLMRRKVFEAKVPSHRYKTTTLIAARFQECFTPIAMQMLCPLLDDRHVLIMDNASFHKGSETEALIRGSGASLLFR